MSHDLVGKEDAVEASDLLKKAREEMRPAAERALSLEEARLRVAKLLNTSLGSALLSLELELAGACAPDCKGLEVMPGEFSGCRCFECFSEKQLDLVEKCGCPGHPPRATEEDRAGCENLIRATKEMIAGTEGLIRKLSTSRIIRPGFRPRDVKVRG